MPSWIATPERSAGARSLEGASSGAQRLEGVNSEAPTQEVVVECLRLRASA